MIARTPSRKYLSKPWVKMLIFLSGLGLSTDGCSSGFQTTACRGVTLKLDREIALSSASSPLPGIIPVSGASGLAWSSDGDRLAFYSDYGKFVQVYRKDGSLVRKFERSCDFLAACSHSLGFLPGHNRLVIGASLRGPWRNAKPSEQNVVERTIFTIYDVDGDRIEQQVEGPWPDQLSPANRAQEIAVSLDGRFIAGTHQAPHEGTVSVYSADRLKPTAALTVSRRLSADLLSFSPDSRLLAAIDYDVIRLYSTVNWSEIKSFSPFGHQTRSDGMNMPMGVIAFAFSPSAKYIATAAAHGGIQHLDSRGRIVFEGGSIRTYNPTDPIRAFDLSSGVQSMSISGIPTVEIGHSMAWLSRPDRIFLLLLDGSLRIVDPNNNSICSIFLASQSYTLAASNFGSLAVATPDRILIITTTTN